MTATSAMAATTAKPGTAAVETTVDAGSARSPSHCSVATATPSRTQKTRPAPVIR